ncbi:iron complex outermembrane receptor protein [Sphingobium sp. B11D3B]|uniref:TonB-dependent receptor n=1 Tax=Sphingobium sp. B11D3B TaxID=2940575 RepID=UPI002226189F|nr:TonB-dependent receptor [Sphingobium sp. B11D3B]MCW2390213.1 iron complex outermembrane receptor protein [Sphingobium sp. B11D3B]
MNFHRSSQMLKAALIASAAAVAAPAAAQEASEIIVTAQRENRSAVTLGGNVGVLGEKSAENVPFSVKSYNAALILNQQPQTLGQVLENDPSVRTTYGFGNAAEQFVIRGFPLYGDDVGLDGLYGITPRQLVAPELYESVQVLNGASAFLNGAAPGGSGIGGSVNLVPKRATGRLSRATLNYTSGEHFGGSLDLARRFPAGAGTMGVRINGVARGGDVAIDGEYRSTYAVGAAFDYDGGPLRMSLDLAYNRVHVRGLRPKVTIASTSIPAVPEADANYAQPWTYTTMRDIFGLARLEYDLADNAMLYVMGGARDGMEDGIYGGITVSDAVTGAASGNGLYVPRTDNNEAVQAGIRINLAAGGITHEFNIGGSATWQVNRNAYDFLYGPGFAGFATNLYDAQPVTIPSSALVGGDLDNPFPISRTKLLSVFASDTVGLLGDRVLLTVGGRIQQIRTSSYSYGNGALDSAYKNSALTPVVGLVIKPVAGLSLFANRIESLAQGPVAPLSGFYPGLGTLPVSNAGEIFQPYLSVQYEVGGKLALGPVSASLAAFQIEKPLGQVAPDPTNSAALVYDLFGTQRNRGLELSVSGELTPGLRIIAGGSVIEAELRDTPGGLQDGNGAQGVPDHLLNANVEWDLPFLPALTLTGRVVQTGKQWLDTANTLRLPSWTRVDVGMRYVAVVAQRPLTLRFNVDNVANERYWASAYDAFGQTLLQGAPRTYKASLSVDF